MTWGKMAIHQKRWQELHDRLRLNRIKRYWLELINFTTSVTAIILFVAAIVGAKELVPWYVFILIVYLGISIVSNFIQHYYYGRKARYAEASLIFHPICHIVRDAMYNVHKIDEDDLKQTLEQVLTAFASGFEIIIGAKVRACIKKLEYDNEEELLKAENTERRCEYIYVRNYAHSPGNWSEKVKLNYPYDKDRLSHNSAFRELLTMKRMYYIESNIPKAYKDHRYQSTSFMRYGEKQDSTWPLPYRSTILWPIRKLVGEKYGLPEDSAIPDHRVRGFLCIDSWEKNVWWDRYDSQIGAAVADLIFILMDAWLDPKESPQDQEKNKKH